MNGTEDYQREMTFLGGIYSSVILAFQNLPGSALQWVGKSQRLQWVGKSQRFQGNLRVAHEEQLLFMVSCDSNNAKKTTFTGEVLSDPHTWRSQL